ncbi:MAG: hypothetical protein CFH01_01414, partial [Alphaproteobacteria bacterium MarineAlpha2_Bin1]
KLFAIAFDSKANIGFSSFNDNSFDLSFFLFNFVTFILIVYGTAKSEKHNFYLGLLIAGGCRDIKTAIPTETAPK